MVEVDHASFEQDFSELFEGTLSPGRAREVNEHLASCARCRTELAAFRETMGVLAGLPREPAPTHFEEQVAGTIHRRSAGRFFGRRAFGDRIPYGLIALVALVLGLGVALLHRASVTGSVHEPLRSAPAAPPSAPGARDVVPLP